MSSRFRTGFRRIDAARRRGFTLVEVTAACVLLLVLAGIAATGLRGRMTTVRLTQAVERIETADRAARVLARNTGRTVVLQFNRTAGRLDVLAGKQVHKTVRLPGGVTLQEVRVSGRGGRFREQVFVSPLARSATYAVTLGTGTNTRTLVVAGLSGQSIRVTDREQADALLRL